jgi:hypothetical protein
MNNVQKLEYFSVQLTFLWIENVMDEEVIDFDFDEIEFNGKIRAQVVSLLQISDLLLILFLSRYACYYLSSSIQSVFGSFNISRQRPTPMNCTLAMKIFSSIEFRKLSFYLVVKLCNVV